MTLKLIKYTQHHVKMPVFVSIHVNIVSSVFSDCTQLTGLKVTAA